MGQSLLGVHMRLLAMNLIFVSCDMQDIVAVAAWQRPFWRLFIPFPTITWMHLLSLLGCQNWQLRLLVHLPRSFSTGYCRTPRGPKALSVFAVHMVTVCGGWRGAGDRSRQRVGGAGGVCSVGTIARRLHKKGALNAADKNVMFET